MSGAHAEKQVAATVTSFRVAKRKFAKTAFSGSGARLYGGRWNSIGTPMVYTAGSLSLSLLEWRAHLAQWPAPPLMVIEVEIEEHLIWTPRKLPADWKRLPLGRGSAIFGDDWVRSQRSAVMRVPSVIVPSEWNYLLNPTHPDFQRLRIGKPRGLRPDPRLGPLP